MTLWKVDQVVDSDQSDEDAGEGGREGHVSGQHGHRLLPEVAVTHHSDQRYAEVDRRQRSHHRLHPGVQHVQKVRLTRDSSKTDRPDRCLEPLCD